MSVVRESGVQWRRLLGVGFFLIGTWAFLRKVLETSSEEKVAAERPQVATAQLDDLHSGLFELRGAEWRLRDGKVPAQHRRLTPRSVAHTALLDCHQIEQLLSQSTVSFVASGWTKAVFKVKHKRDRSEFALKTVDLTGRHVSQCVAQRHIGTAGCYEEAARKLIKEVALLYYLRHSSVVEMLGYCLPQQSARQEQDAVHRISILTELGDPIDLIKLLQATWEDRLKVVLSLTQLLKFLTLSRLGSVIMTDMRRQQFVIVDGQAKLVDVDDVGIEEPHCSDDDACTALVEGLQSFATGSSSSRRPHRRKISCQNHVCTGFNELRNIHSAAHHFINFLLPYGAPTELQMPVSLLVEMFRNQNGSIEQMSSLLDHILHEYSSGRYVLRIEAQKLNDSYTELLDHSMDGANDYACAGSSSLRACIMSVASLEEAQKLCSSQSVCRGFVWTQDKSWTGRNIVHFKNAFSNITRLRVDGQKLFVKSR